ncbi:MAG: hypothetical protein FD153_218 [Rhodospirillaceae bacterium]|nr:MAG: hypothetical protein FD153_218 [Rhodospirillaceae bacterium]
MIGCGNDLLHELVDDRIFDPDQVIAAPDICCLAAPVVALFIAG